MKLSAHFYKVTLREERGLFSAMKSSKFLGIIPNEPSFFYYYYLHIEIVCTSYWNHFHNSLFYMHDQQDKSQFYMHDWDGYTPLLILSLHLLSLQWSCGCWPMWERSSMASLSSSWVRTHFITIPFIKANITYSM